MPTAPSSSSAWQARRDLGARLGEIRRDAGLTGRTLARLCGWHESKVSRVEHAVTAPSDEDVRAWCRHCGADGRAAWAPALGCVAADRVPGRGPDRCGPGRHVARRGLLAVR